ncbi:MAG: AAA family ATPase [Phycisphaerales bacterium]
MRTVAIVNQKGGCGKTTVSINLASALAELGKKVLLVDMDPQSHCAVGLAVPEEQIEQSIYDVLISRSRNEPIRLTEILWQIGENLELAPASIDLSAFEQQMAGIADRETSLKTVLDEIKDEYDFAVVDCPPAVSLLTFNALRASTDVVVPVETGYFALHGLSKQLETLGVLCKRCQQNVSVRVLASMYDIRTKMAREILAELRSHFGDRMFRTVVNFNTRIKEASSFGQPINEYDPASKGQQDFHQLAQEVVGSEDQPQVKSKRLVDSLADQLEAIGASANDLLKATKPPVAAAPAKGTQREAPVQVVVTPQPAVVAETKPVVAPAPAPKPTVTVRPEPVVAAAPKVVEEPAEEPVEVETKVETRTEARADASDQLDAKLANYYGVSQIQDAVVFVTLYPRAESVQIAGDFNNWQPDGTPMQRVGDSGVWQAKVKLPSGLYRYRLVVDGQWQQDPYNER